MDPGSRQPKTDFIYRRGLPCCSYFYKNRNRVVYFEQTNQVYVVEFCPQRARKHSVYFMHKNVESLNRGRIEKLVNGAVLKIAVYHAQTGDLYEEVARMGFSTSEYKATPIYTFSTADLPWKYTDKLRIEIVPLALNLKLNESETELSKTELHIAECHPFY